MGREISAAESKKLVHDGAEIAFLDLREAGEFGEGHPLFAVPCPYSRLEALVARLAPRRDVRVLLIDGGDGVAAGAAGILGDLGYGAVQWVHGGAPAWIEAGFTLFQGVNVPSKTLGELAEHAWHPATIDAAALARWQEEGRRFAFFDARPAAEYAKMRVPGAVCLPNGELAHRFPVAVEDGSAPVVVTCAGRTRGIVGVLGLTLAGIETPVYALENGTQGWQLAGFTLERGNAADPFPPLDAGGARITRARAEAFLRRHDIAVLGPAEVEAWRAEMTRTTYLFDLRSPAEISDDPAPAFLPALSGQLVQATDQWVGVRHARLVLLDDLGLRAGLAAFWLRQLGFEVAVARIDDDLRRLTPRQRVRSLPTPASCSAVEALQAVQAEAGRFVDLRPSNDYRAGHVAGALWSIRPRLRRLPLQPGQALYLIGGDMDVVALAAKELGSLGVVSACAVEGGQPALAAAGAAIEAGEATANPEKAIDFLHFVHDRHDGNLEASRRYLAWEQGLIAQLDEAERAAFVLSDWSAR
ncbi:MAG: rhodanese-like domain-containing protein [Kiloniellaceae bacterium]